jgi:hypothetical protein
MPSGPRPFDDGDDPASSWPDNAPPPPSSESSPRPDDRPAASRNRPNYLVRRAIVVGGVVAVLATASVVIGQLMGSGGSGDTSGAILAEWNRIVLLDERTGRVTVMDEEGEVLGRLDSGVDTPTGSGVVENSMMIISTDNVAVLDLDRAGDESTDTPTTDAVPTTAPSTDPTDSAADPTDSASDERPEPDTNGATTTFGFGADGVITPAGSALTMIAPRADAGRGVLVHGPSGDIIDTDSFAPVVGARYEFATSRATPSGRDVLVTDSGNFQSVLFSFDADAPSFFPGLALAVDDDVVITAQNVGTDATINVFDHAGDALVTGRTPAVRAGMVAGDRAVLITVDGAVIIMDLSSGDTSDGDELEVGTIAAGYVSTSGDRLVVSGADGTALVTADAEKIGTYAGALLADVGRPPTGSQCVALVPAAVDPEPQLRVVDTTDGSSIVDTVDAGVTAEGSERVQLRADASGCTIAIPTSSGFELVTPDGTQLIPTNDTLVAMAPDASRVVVERTGRLLLVDPFTESGDGVAPIDVGREGGVIHFTQS